MNSDVRVVPVILSGGTGTGLWPMSRELFPKQLLPLLAEVSLLQQTAWRVQGHEFSAPLLMCGEEHRFAVAQQMRDLGIEPRAIVLEPVGRGTAPPIAVAARLVAADDPDAVMLVLPSDHAVGDPTAFAEAVRAAAAVAVEGHLVGFGVPATRPETGFGYIRSGVGLVGHDTAYEVKDFVEKPSRAFARDLVAAGDWTWNSGMFVFPPRLFLDELERLRPDVLEAVTGALRTARVDLDFVRLDEREFTRSPTVSVDHAVMEHTGRAAVVNADFGWNDVGSWSGLWQMGDRDQNGNVVLGDVLTDASSGCYLRADGVLLATLGLEETIVVDTSDVVLVANRTHDQQVREVVQKLKDRGRIEASSHRVVYRPWGSYESVDSGPGYQVKHLTVKAGHTLSLQTHEQRAEHWVVISGVADVVRGDETLVLTETMSIDVPVGCPHRLGNTGPGLLHLVEVQTGSYLGEDDIVRLADDYGRHEPR